MANSGIGWRGKKWNGKIHVTLLFGCLMKEGKEHKLKDPPLPFQSLLLNDFDTHFNLV